MLDHGTASRPTGATTYDPDQQADVDIYETVFSSPAKAQEAVGRTQEVGGRTSVRVGIELHLPADTQPLTTGDRFEFGTVHEGSLMAPGDRVRITEPVVGTHRTARRYRVERVIT